MKNISIVLTYFDRQFQLEKTLRSFAESKYKKFNVIIMDDDSAKDIILPDLPYEVTILKLKNKTWHNQCIVYNTGFNYALKSKPDVIIFQNAECFHVGDVISRAAEVKQDEYISFAAFALNEKSTFEGCDLQKEIKENDYACVWDGQHAWYNHPVHRPVGFHFCAVLTRENLIKINGFDERFAFGRAYDDDMLVHQIKSMGLKINIPTDPFVVHQWHYNCQLGGDHAALWARNQNLYANLAQTKWYRSEHLKEGTANFDGSDKYFFTTNI